MLLCYPPQEKHCSPKVASRIDQKDNVMCVKLRKILKGLEISLTFEEFPHSLENWHIFRRHTCLVRQCQYSNLSNKFPNFFICLLFLDYSILSGHCPTTHTSCQRFPYNQVKDIRRSGKLPDRRKTSWQSERLCAWISEYDQYPSSCSSMMLSISKAFDQWPREWPSLHFVNICFTYGLPRFFPFLEDLLW